MSIDVLPVDSSPKKQLLLTSDGKPIWPASTDSELESLVLLARTFGCRVEHVDGTPGKALGGRERVLGLGRGVTRAARLYAHLTQRRLELASTVPDLDSNPPAIIVTTFEHLTPKLMEDLYVNGEGRSVTGIICASDAESLRRQVLVRSAAAALRGSPNNRRLDLFPTLDTTELKVGNRKILGGLVPPELLRQELERSSGVLTLVTHTDGVDAFLSPLTLCSLEGKQSRTKAPQGLPSCLLTGICHRRHLPLDDARRSGKLLSPDTITARVFVFYGCSGLLLRNSFVNPEWGLSHRLLENPSIGAIVTTWQIVFSSPHDMEILSGPISNGMPVGKAVKQFNLSRCAKRTNLRMCLLGDPRVRLPVPESKSQQLIRPRSDMSHKSIKKGEGLRQTAFLRAYMAEIHESREEASRARAARKAIRAYEEATIKPTLQEGSKHSVGPRLRHALINFLFQRGSLPLLDWMRLADRPRAVSIPNKCHYCPQELNSMVSELRVIGTPKRRISICQRCGITEDTPSHFASMEIGIDRGSIIRLIGSLPQTNLTVGIMVDPSIKSERKGWFWPLRHDGSLASSFPMPERWPLGLSHIAVLIMWETHLAISRRPVYRE